jgi:nucleoside-diphosphate-sugar epimerase
MSILVTGTGTVGVQVVRSAIKKGIEDVIALDIAPDNEFIESIAGKNFTLEKGTITYLPFLMELIVKYGVKRIIHTAVVPEENPHLYETIHTNIMGTVNIFEAARLLNVERIIICSTGSVYDFENIRPKAPVQENWPHSVKNWDTYASTKVALEHFSSNYIYKYGMDIVAFRLATTYGPSQAYSMKDKRWIFNLIHNAFINKTIRFDIVPARRLPWTYAKDAANLFVHSAYYKGKPKMETYNCAYPELIDLSDMIQALKELIPDLIIDINEIQDVGWKFPYDVSRTEEDFNFKFQYSPKKAFADYLNWLKSNPQYIKNDN